MAEVKWIKIVTDIFDDEKIILIERLPESDTILVIWFKLLCLAGKQNNSGVFIFKDKIPYTDEMLATIFRRDILTVRLALKTFEEFGMIEIIEGVITIPNWEKHQSLDQLELAKEQTRQRVARHRAKQKELCNVTVTLPVTQCNGDRIDKDIDKDKDIDNIYINIPLNDKTEYPFTNEMLEQYKELYPAVDVEAELKKYKAWAISNPTKRKTRRGILKSINLWLSRVQDKGGSNGRANEKDYGGLDLSRFE